MNRAVLTEISARLHPNYCTISNRIQIAYTLSLVIIRKGFHSLHFISSCQNDPSFRLSWQFTKGSSFMQVRNPSTWQQKLGHFVSIMSTGRRLGDAFKRDGPIISQIISHLVGFGRLKNQEQDKYQVIFACNYKRTYFSVKCLLNVAGKNLIWYRLHFFLAFDFHILLFTVSELCQSYFESLYGLPIDFSCI